MLSVAVVSQASTVLRGGSGATLSVARNAPPGRVPAWARPAAASWEVAAVSQDVAALSQDVAASSKDVIQQDCQTVAHWGVVGASS